MGRFPVQAFALAAALVAIAVAAAAESGDGAETCEVGDATCREEDEASMLQRARARQASLRSGMVPPKKIAVAFEGGGWQAMTAHASAMIGASAATEPEGPVTGLLQDVDIISSNSGGTWLSTSMVFSDDFAAGLDRMKQAALGDTNVEIETVWEEWMAGFYRALPLCNVWEVMAYIGALTARIIATGLNSHHPTVKLLQSQSDILKSRIGLLQANETELQWGALESTAAATFKPLRAIAQACTLYRADWRDTVSKMLSGTAGIGRDVTLGSGRHDAWAEGKTLAMAIAVPARTKDPSPDVPLLPNITRNYLCGITDTGLYYTSVGPKVAPYVPAKVAYTLGSSSQPPRHFCGAANCFGMQFEYSEDGGVVDMGPVLDEAFVGQASMLPVVEVASASSAWDGAEEVANQLLSEFFFLGNAAVWGARGQDGDAFGTGQKTQNLAVALKKVAMVVGRGKLAASKALFPLVDGVFSDNTAISTAIAEGATEVVSFQITGMTGKPDSDRLFSETGYGGAGRIFKNMTPEEFMSAFEAAPDRVKGPTNSSLAEIVLLQKEFTTVGNPNFGIEADAIVKVTFVWVVTTGISLGPPLTSLHSFGPVMRDVTSTLVANPDFATKIAAALRK